MPTFKLPHTPVGPHFLYTHFHELPHSTSKPFTFTPPFDPPFSPSLHNVITSPRFLCEVEEE